MISGLDMSPTALNQPSLTWHRLILYIRPRLKSAKLEFPFPLKDLMGLDGIH